MPPCAVRDRGGAIRPASRNALGRRVPPRRFCRLHRGGRGQLLERSGSCGARLPNGTIVTAGCDDGFFLCSRRESIHFQGIILLYFESRGGVQSSAMGSGRMACSNLLFGNITACRIILQDRAMLEIASIY
jgi:hypothetical protein